MASLSPLEHTAIGGLAGMIEVCIMQPTVGIKNALQEGRPVPSSPLALYRGLLVNAASIAPITAIQFGAHRAIEQALQATFASGELPHSAQIAAGLGAGMASAAVSCPAEVVMIQQQKHGRSLFGEARAYVSSHGALRLYRGMSMTATRDGIYTAGYLGIAPALKDYLQEVPVVRRTHEALPFVLSGIAGGLFAALVTQPADTVKTRMQAFPDVRDKPHYRTALSTAAYLVRTQGFASLWAGILPRAFRIVGATIILQVVRNKTIEAMERSRNADL